MKLGDAFVNAATSGYPPHLWIVVSRPNGADRVVIVNLSSDDGGLGDLDALAKSDHPWLDYDSFIRTDLARLTLVEELRKVCAKRPPLVHPKPSASEVTIRKLQRALCASRHTRREIKAVLLEQGYG